MNAVPDCNLNIIVYCIIQEGLVKWNFMLLFLTDSNHTKPVYVQPLYINLILKGVAFEVIEG